MPFRASLSRTLPRSERPRRQRTANKQAEGPAAASGFRASHLH
jgi:hypothetical protein